MMYYYWKKKGIRPSVFYTMPRGELIILKAFYEEEIKEQEKLIKSGATCPMMFM